MLEKSMKKDDFIEDRFIFMNKSRQKPLLSFFKKRREKKEEKEPRSPFLVTLRTPPLVPSTIFNEIFTRQSVLFCRVRRILRRILP